MAPGFLNAQNAGWYRFRFGDFECTVVSDGPLLDPNNAADLFPNADPEQVRELRRQNFLPTDHTVFPQNALIVNTGQHLVLIDTGMGSSKLAGPDAGRLLTNMRAAGIDPKQIDHVLLTHAHPDHCFGMVDDAGHKNFPNAGLILSEADLSFWTDEAKLADPGIMSDIVAGARKNILPYADQMSFALDEREVVPGITAISTPGHTFGHYIYVIHSQGKNLANVGDLCHDYIGELTHPEWHFTFDADAEMAVKTRLRMFGQIAREEMSILGYHFPWPGYGHLRAEKTGYVYVATPLPL